MNWAQGVKTVSRAKLNKWTEVFHAIPIKIEDQAILAPLHATRVIIMEMNFRRRRHVLEKEFITAQVSGL